jgi:integration host factor subunit alpha
MTKAEIIDCVYEKVGGFSKKESAEVVEAVFETMKDVLSHGDKVKISGFGNFVVREKKERASGGIRRPAIQSPSARVAC